MKNKLTESDCSLLHECSLMLADAAHLILGDFPILPWEERSILLLLALLRVSCCLLFDLLVASRSRWSDSGNRGRFLVHLLVRGWLGGFQDALLQSDQVVVVSCGIISGRLLLLLFALGCHVLLLFVYMLKSASIFRGSCCLN